MLVVCRRLFAPALREHERSRSRQLSAYRGFIGEAVAGSELAWQSSIAEASGVGMQELQYVRALWLGAHVAWLGAASLGSLRSAGGRRVIAVRVVQCVVECCLWHSTEHVL